MSGGFVGRPVELDALRKCAAKAVDGHPQLVFVEGAPGIGKSSLLAQFAATLSGWRKLSWQATRTKSELRSVCCPECCRSAGRPSR